MTPQVITPQTIEAHQLTEPEYEKIVSLLGREPTYTELGIFSVMWSEHCSYKSSRIHLKKLPTRSKLVLQGPGENAGIIDIGDGYAIAFKIESHNHPSFIEPFQGAATGVGGILRDIFTMGARPIAVMDAIRFGPLDIPRNRRILEGVVSGIAHYGNCFGVPTVGGECVFRRLLQRQSAGERVRAGRLPQGRSLLRQGQGRRQSGDLRRREDRAATAFTARPWRRPSSPRNPSRSGRTCRWAIRFSKSFCSKPVWKRCGPAPSSAFRTWAPPD